MKFSEFRTFFSGGDAITINMNWVETYEEMGDKVKLTMLSGRIIMIDNIKAEKDVEEED